MAAWPLRAWLVALGATGVFTAASAAVETVEAKSVASHTLAVGDAAPKISLAPLSPGPNDGRIAYVTAQMLWQNHYSHHPLDNTYSEMFFDRYLEALDPQHLHFTQADLTEFNHYRDRLDDLTVTNKRTGDATPAFEIFNRFLQRLEQRVAFAEQELKQAKFEFTAEERMPISRKDAPYPQDLEAAKKLWWQRLRYEYLQEKLAKHSAKDAPQAKGTSTEPAHSAALQNTAGEGRKKSESEEIVETLSRRYARNLRLFREWDNEDVMQTYLTALAHVYDPHSDYMNKLQADNFAIGMNNTLFGIGAVLTTDLDGFCKIQELKPGPAMNSKKIKAGDRIVAVAQSNAPPVDAIEMALNKVVQMIRGPKGTEVRLTVQPANKDAADRYVLSLVRDEIKLEDQAAKGKVIELPSSGAEPLRLGVIDLPSFYAPMDVGRLASLPEMERAGRHNYGRYTSVDVAALLRKFKDEKVSGVILDLRRNGGGSLEEAIKLTGLFIKEGPVVQVRNSNGDVVEDRDDVDGVAYDGPLIILTSRFSASASEILAGALQDYGRALIVGDQSTHGKGTVQNLNALRPWVTPATATATNDPGALKVTIRKFYRASGASTQLKGVLPDIVLPSVLNYSEDIGESAFENALAWDEIPSAKFQKVGLVTPYLGELLRRSSARIATNQDYVYIREDIEKFRTAQADKTVSLNEAQRLKEKEEGEARQKARDKERLARKESDAKVYELALKQVDLPGLPPPVQKTNAELAKLTGNKTTAAGFSTNSAAVTPKAISPGPGLEDEAEEEKAPAVDATLEEAERILTDYISLLNKKNLAKTEP